MTRLRIAQLWVATIVLGAGLAALPASAASTQTFTGKVSDSMCGAKHSAGVVSCHLRSCLCEERREVCPGGRRQGLYVGDRESSQSG